MPQMTVQYFPAFGRISSPVNFPSLLRYTCLYPPASLLYCCCCCPWVFFGKLQCHAELILTRRKKSWLCLSAQLFGTSKILLMDWICHFFIQVFFTKLIFPFIDFCQQALQFKGKLITSNSCIFSMNGKTISVWNWKQILCTQMLQNLLFNIE